MKLLKVDRVDVQVGNLPEGLAIGVDHRGKSLAVKTVADHGAAEHAIRPSVQTKRCRFRFAVRTKVMDTRSQ